MIKFIGDIMTYAMPLTVILLLSALGGMMSERSGVVNIALEGLMLIGAFSTAIFINIVVSKTHLGYGGVWIAILIGGIIAALISILHAVASVTFNADQVISGTAINMLAPAATIYVARLVTGTQNVQTTRSIKRINLPILSEIPIIGKWFFSNTTATTFVAIGIGVLVWFIVFKTSFGLRLRACGEHPQAADSMGINVYKIRYIGVISSGFLSGLAGGLYITTISGEFNGDVAGLGFLALAALIFGKWKPLNVLGAAFFFAFMKTLGLAAVSDPFLKNIKLPIEIYNMLPYAMTIIALVVFSRDIVGPKAAGQPYDKGKR